MPHRPRPRPTASVVIPALNEAGFIRSTIASVRRRYEPEDVEIVVADGGSTDGTAERLPPETRLVRTTPGRAHQLNTGARVSRGRTLVFCHADTRLPAGWLEAVQEALRRPGVSGGAFQPSFHPATGILRIMNLPPPLRYPAHWLFVYGDQAQFTDRGTFHRVGGFPEMALMEDLELARRLRREGRLVRLPLRVTTSSRRFLQTRPVSQQALNTWLVLRHVLTSPPAETLAARYAGADAPTNRCGTTAPLRA